MVAASPAPSIIQVAHLSLNITIYDTRYATCCRTSITAGVSPLVRDRAPALTPGMPPGGYPAVLASP